jgi:hypothetical protein
LKRAGLDGRACGRVIIVVMSPSVKAVLFVAGALLLLWLALGGRPRAPHAQGGTPNGESRFADPNSLEPGAQGESGSLDEEIESPELKREPPQ